MYSENSTLSEINYGSFICVSRERNVYHFYFLLQNSKNNFLYILFKTHHFFFKAYFELKMFYHFCLLLLFCITEINFFQQVNDPALAQCLGLSCSTYKVEEMGQEETNTFSSLHNKLSAAAISITPKSAMKVMVKDENGDLQHTSLDDPSSIANSRLFKRELESPSPIKTFPESKRSRQSSFVPLEPIGNATSISSTQSDSNPAFFNVSAQLQTNSLDKPPMDRSDSSLSSVSSLSVSSIPSPKSQSKEPLQTHTSSPSLFQAPISATVVSSKSEPTTTPSKQNVSYIFKPNQSMEHTILTTDQGLTDTDKPNNQAQTFPVLINKGTTQTGSTPQVLPYFLGATNGSGVQQKVVIAPPSASSPSESINMPIVLAGNSSQGGTVLLSTGAGMPPQRVMVRQQQQNTSKTLPTQVILAPQHKLSSTKVQSKQTTSLLPPRLPLSAKKSPATPPSNNSTTRSLLKRPAEVKVSRQLFHDATSSNPSVLSNGQALNDSIKTIPFMVDSIKPETATSSHHPSLYIKQNVLDNGVEIDKSVLSDKIDSEHLSLMETTEQVFISDASTIDKSCNDLMVSKANVSDPELDALSSGVLNLSGEELVSLNTSTDSLNGVYSSVPSSVINSSGIVLEAGSMSDELSLVSTSAISNTNGNVSVMSSPQIPVTHSDTQTLYSSNSNPDIDRISSLINGSSSEFSTDLNHERLKTTNGNSLKPETSFLSPSTEHDRQSFIISSSSDFMNIAKPSSPMTTSPSKEQLCSLTGTTINIGTNGAISSHMLHSDDLSGLQLNNHTDVNMKDQNQTSGLMSQPMSDQVSDGLALDSSGDVGMTETLQVTGEGGEMPPLFTEGLQNIYQTEDGTLFIQSANGQTYQLQGAQDVPLETVHALLSGQIAVDSAVDS